MAESIHVLAGGFLEAGEEPYFTDKAPAQDRWDSLGSAFPTSPSVLSFLLSNRLPETVAGCSRQGRLSTVPSSAVKFPRMPTSTYSPLPLLVSPWGTLSAQLWDTMAHGAGVRLPGCLTIPASSSGTRAAFGLSLTLVALHELVAWEVVTTMGQEGRQGGEERKWRGVFGDLSILWL